MAGETFGGEQSKINQLQESAKEKKHDSLEQTLANNRDTFFKQVDDLQKVYQQTEANLKTPEAKKQMAGEKEKVRQYLLQVAADGQNILEKKSDAGSINQIAANLKAEMQRVRNVLPAYQAVDEGKSKLDKTDPKVAKVQELMHADKVDLKKLAKAADEASEQLALAHDPLVSLIVPNLPAQLLPLYLQTEGKYQNSMSIIGEAQTKYLVSKEWLKGQPEIQEKAFKIKDASEKMPELLKATDSVLADLKDEKKLADPANLSKLEGSINSSIDGLSNLSKSLKFNGLEGFEELNALQQKLQMQSTQAIEALFSAKLFLQTSQLSKTAEMQKYFSMDKNGVVTKTPEFDKLPPEKQAELKAKFDGLKQQLGQEMDEKLAIGPEKLWIEGKKKLGSGDIFGAKADLLKFVNDSNKETEQAKVTESRAMLQAIGVQEVRNALGMLQGMRNSIDARMDWSEFGARQTYGALDKRQAQAFLDGQEAMLNRAAELLQSGKVDTLEQAKHELMSIDTSSFRGGSLMRAQEQKAEWENKKAPELIVEKTAVLVRLQSQLAEVKAKLAQPYENLPGQFATAEVRKGRDEDSFKGLNAEIERYTKMSPEEFQAEKVKGINGTIAGLNVQRGVNDIRTGFSIDMNRRAAEYFDVFAMQAKLSEADPVKRQENLRELANQARDRGEPEMARMLFDQFFAQQKREAAKRLEQQGTTRDSFKAEFLKDEKSMARIDQQVKLWQEKFKKDNGKDATDQQIAEAKRQMTESMVSSGYMKKVNSSVNAEASNGDESWKKEWRDKYQGFVGLADVGQTGTFQNWWSDEQWNELPAKVAISASIIIVSGGIGTAAVGALGLSAELAAGASLATRIGYGALQVGVEGAVFESSRGLLSGAIEGDWSMYSSPEAYLKAVGQGILTFGVLKGVGAGFSKFRGAVEGGANMTEEAALAAYEKSLTTGFAAKGATEGAWWLGKTTMEGTALTGMSAGQAWVMGENFSAKDFAKGVGDNFIFSAAIGGVHGFMGGHGEAPEKPQTKETIEAVDAIRSQADNMVKIDNAEVALKKARETGNQTEVTKLEQQLALLRTESKGLESKVQQKLIDETKREIADAQKNIEALQKKIDDGMAKGKDVSDLMRQYEGLKQYNDFNLAKLNQQGGSLDSHYNSAFSSGVDFLNAAAAAGKLEGAKDPKNVAGWIDESGQIHYGQEYFKDKFGVEMKQADGKNVFVIDGKEVSPMEFFRTPKGREILSEMKKVKDHEVTHRLVEASGVPENVAKFISNDAQMKALVEKSGNKMDASGLQEFLCRVADGSVKLTDVQKTQLEMLMGEKIPNFSFDRVRQLDTKMLATITPEALARMGFAPMLRDVPHIFNVMGHNGLIENCHVIGETADGKVWIEYTNQNGANERTYFNNRNDLYASIEYAHTNFPDKVLPTEFAVVIDAATGETAKMKIMNANPNGKVIASGINKNGDLVTVVFASKQELVASINDAKKVEGLKTWMDGTFGQTGGGFIQVEAPDGTRSYIRNVSLDPKTNTITYGSSGTGKLTDASVPISVPLSEFLQYKKPTTRRPVMKIDESILQNVRNQNAQDSKVDQPSLFGQVPEVDTNGLKGVEGQKVFDNIMAGFEVKAFGATKFYTHGNDSISGAYYDAATGRVGFSRYNEATRAWIPDGMAVAEFREKYGKGGGAPNEEPLPILQQREIRDVARTNVVNMIGDLHGNAEIATLNMKSLGAISASSDMTKPDTVQWAGGNRKIVFHGDILADRGNTSLPIMESIARLREQAKAAGGDVILLAGNHDDAAVAFLTGDKIAGGGDVEQLMQGGQIDGLTEFAAKYSGNPNLANAQNFMDMLGKSGNYDQLKGQILTNMRASPEGRKMLEAMCQMKIVEVIDDSIFTHTDPTPEMIAMLNQPGVSTAEAAKRINAEYQASLRAQLLGEGTVSPNYRQIIDTFLNTNNRMASVDLSGIKGQGYNRWIHGHSDNRDEVVGSASYTAGGVEVASVDFAAGKKGRNMEERSVGTIGIDGGFMSGVALGDMNKFTATGRIEGGMKDHFSFNTPENKNNNVWIDRAKDPTLNSLLDQARALRTNDPNQLQQVLRQIIQLANNAADKPDAFKKASELNGSMYLGQIIDRGAVGPSQRAALLQMMCAEAGLEMTMVKGSVNGVPHSWNEVNLNGYRYVMDTVYLPQRANSIAVGVGTLDSPFYKDVNGNNLYLTPAAKARYGGI